MRLLVDQEKVEYLVQQLVCLETWRHNILPIILKGEDIKTSFPIYSTLFHESSCLTLLESTLFHRQGTGVYLGRGGHLPKFLYEKMKNKMDNRIVEVRRS